MINLDDFEIFRTNKKSLKETSVDDSDESNDNDSTNIQYMTESPLTAISFDDVKTQFTNSFGLSEENAASVDALLDSFHNIVFIEFKNGKLKNGNEKNKIKDKVRDSLLIFGAITNTTISYTRQNAIFVLVYNVVKNPIPNQLTKDLPLEEPQDSPSRVVIAKHFTGKAKEEFIRFGLERFKTLYFKEVHTYSQEEFEDYLNHL